MSRRGMPYPDICHRYFFYDELIQDPVAHERVQRYWLDVRERLSLTHAEAISRAQEHEIYVFEKPNIVTGEQKVLYFESVYEACAHYNCLHDPPSKSTGKRQGRVSTLLQGPRLKKIERVWKPNRGKNVNGNDAKYWQPLTTEQNSALALAKLHEGNVRFWANKTLNHMYYRIKAKNEIRLQQGVELLDLPEWSDQDGCDSFREYLVRYLKDWAIYDEVIPVCATSKRIFTSINQLSPERVFNRFTYRSKNLFMVWRHFNMGSSQCHFNRETFDLIKVLRSGVYRKLPFEYVPPVEGVPLSAAVRNALLSLLNQAHGSIARRNEIRDRQGRTLLGPVKLTYADLERLWRQLRGLCGYSKIPMDPQRGDGIKFKVSLERIHDDDTYWIGNVTLVCHEFNTWEGELMDAKKWTPELCDRYFG